MQPHALALPVPVITDWPSTTQQPVDYKNSVRSNALRFCDERISRPLETKGRMAIKSATPQLNNHFFNLVVFALINHFRVNFSNWKTLTVQQCLMHFKLTDHRANSKLAPRRPRASRVDTPCAPSSSTSYSSGWNLCVRKSDDSTTSCAQGKSIFRRRKTTSSQY